MLQKCFPWQRRGKCIPHRETAWKGIASCFLWSAWIACHAHHAPAATVILKDGRVLMGSTARIPTLARKPDGPDRVPLIVMVDDDLRRTFVSLHQIRADGVTPEDDLQSMQRILLHQRVTSGRRLGSIGVLFRVAPFDEYGRRLVQLAGPKRDINVLQGITEITPRWTRVESLQMAKTASYEWDMRIATSSIPRDTLHTILDKKIDRTKKEDRLQLVRLFLQGERYGDAREELAEILREFPDAAEDLGPQLAALRQLEAEQLLRELQRRKNGGQHRLVRNLLAEFPTEGVAGETLIEVREELDAYSQAETAYEAFKASFAENRALVTEELYRVPLETVQRELSAELSLETWFNTSQRMASYLRFESDTATDNEQKLSLAISGWLVGSSLAQANLPTTLSLWQVRQMVRDYLRELDPGRRRLILTELRSQEGATPKYIAALLDHMKPPLDPPEAVEGIDGYFQVELPAEEDELPLGYHIQLPPEYDPYRRYPAILTLHGAMSTAAQQIDWWAGEVNEQGQRIGQAARHGYIVIAVPWAGDKQTVYGYSAREHQIILDCYRDACRKFSIDTDRVFLSGHSMGGDAAWDLGLAHPDLWAGVIPITAQGKKYCQHYTLNAKHVPLYFVGGELDGDKMFENAPILDRYLTRSGFDVTVVEYRGRGHEHFQDEIQRLFEWMGLHRRNFFPEDFTAVTMRPWDRFFWWAEVDGLPSRVTILPHQFPARNPRPMQIHGTVNVRNNRLRVTTGSKFVTLWLTPEMIDFNRRIELQINSRRTSDDYLEPDIETILEDVRLRADRQHPFWVRLAMQAGR